jgi:hypothetical protein
MKDMDNNIVDEKDLRDIENSKELSVANTHSLTALTEGYSLL